MAERKVNNNNNNNSSNNNNNRNNNKNNRNERNERNVNNKGDNKGDRKNGERLDDSKEQADLATAQKQLDKLKDVNKNLTESIFESGKKIEKCREEIGNIKKSKVNYREQRAEIFDMLRKYSDRMNLIASELKAKKDEAMLLKKEFPFPSKKDGIPNLIAKNIAYYERQIAKIEDVLHMESLTSGEVKMKTSQLEKERSKLNDVIRFNNLWLEVTAYQEHNNGLFEQKKKYKEKLVAIEKEEESFASLIEAQNVKIKAFTEEIEKIKEKRKQNNVEITAASKVKDEKKAILNKRWEEWKAQQSILRKQRAEEANALRQQRELQNKEREEQKVKKQDAADAKKILDETNRPYAVEIKACEFLLKYIKEIKINKQKLDAPIKKIPMDIVVKFETLSLNPPFVGKDIETISQTLVDKKKYFTELRDATLQQQKEKNKVEKPSEIVIEEAQQNGEAKEEAKVEEKVEEKQNEEEVKEEAKEDAIEEKQEEVKEEHKEEAKEEAKVEENAEEKQNGEEVKEEHKEEETVESN